MKAILSGNSRYGIVLLVALLGYGLSYYIYSTVEQYEQTQFENSFLIKSKDHVTSIKNNLTSSLDNLDYLTAYFNSTTEISRKNFSNYSNTLLSKTPIVKLLSWNPKVSAEGRLAFEQAILKEGYSGFQIVEGSNQGGVLRAENRDEYFPVNFMEPAKGNEKAFGFDLASNPERKNTLLAADASGGKRSTATIKLIQDNEEHWAYIVFKPLYSSVRFDLAARGKELRGFFSAVLKVDHILSKSIEPSEPKGLDVYLFDISAPVENQFLAAHLSRMRSKAAHVETNRDSLMLSPVLYSEPLIFAGRQLMIVSLPAPELLLMHQSWMPMITLLAGLLLVTLFVLCLLLLLKRVEEGGQKTSELERLVAERTLSLEKANQSLTESVRELNLAQGIANMGSWHWNMIDGSEWWSDQAYRIHGLNPETTTPSYELFLKLIHSDDKQKLLTAVEEAQVSGEYSCEFRAIRPDQSIVYLHAQAKVSFDAARQAIAMDGTVIDITNRKHAERSIRESEQRMQSILDNTTAVIYLKDLEGKYILINRQFEELFDVTRNSINGKTDHDIFPEKMANAFRQNDLLVLQENSPKELEEYAPHEDGIHTYLSIKFPMYDVNGEAYGVCGISTDITERSNTERAVQQSEQRLKQMILDAPIPIMVHAEDGEVNLISHKWTELTGYTHDEIPTIQDWTDRAYGNLGAEARKVISNLYHLEHSSHGGEYVIRTASGEARSWDFYSTNLGENEGRNFTVSMAIDTTDRRKVELEMTQLATGTRYAAEAISVEDCDARILYANPAFEKLTGYALDEVSGQFASLLRSDRHDDTFYKGMCDTVSAGKVWSGELFIKRKDDSLCQVERTIAPAFDEQGRVINHVIIQRDITRRKEDEEALLESRSRFSGIVELAADAIISINEKHIITLFNQSAEKMFGYDQLQMLGEPVEKVIPERFRETHRRGVERFKLGEDNTYLHRRGGMFGLRKNGEEFPVDASITKQVFNDETIMTVMIRDLTDQTKAEDVQRKMMKAISEAGEAVIITDRNAVIEYVNPAFSKITGYEKNEAIGNNPSMLKSHAQDPAFYQDLWQTISSGKVWNGTLIDRRKDGTFYPALMNVAPIHDESGEITHFVSLQQDMTEYKKLEDQFLQAQKMEAIGTLVGGIAHDFNNMLAAAQGNIFLAKKKLEDPIAVTKKLDNIECLNARAAGIVRQLLTFARKDRIEMKSIPLNAFIKEGLKLAKSAIPENIQFVKEITEQEMTVLGDATQLQQVLMNLLNNARDAVAEVEKPQVTTQLSLYQPTELFRHTHPDIEGEALAHLLVQDNGCGIPPELIDKVLEPFFTTKGVGKGTGLGLAMVYGAVQMHRGVIEVDSEVGRGTAINIYLPLLQERRKEQREVREEVAEGQGEVILLVDDEEGLLETVSEVLKSLGYLVVEASNGEIAFEYYKEHADEVSIVISDVIMPVMGGVELTQNIRKVTNELPVILATGYDLSGHIEELSLLENCSVIGKPYEIAELSRIVSSMLKREP